MTTPSPPPPAQPTGLDDPALPLAVATVLVTATSAAVATASLTAAFGLTGWPRISVSLVLSDVMSYPPPVTGVIGAASERTSRLNMARRAQYVLAASKRVLGAVRDGQAAGRMAAVTAQLGRERRFYAQHQAAMWNRARAAGQTDLAAAEHGSLLGWNTVRDSKTSAECKAADGWNFYATAMPDIGFPGGVHPHCRCFPGPPHPGARLLPGHGGWVRAA